MAKIGCRERCVRTSLGSVGFVPTRLRAGTARMTRSSLALAILLMSMLMCGSIAEAQSTAPPFEDYDSFVQWMRKNHKAPFRPGWVPKSSTTAGSGSSAAGGASDGDAQTNNSVLRAPAIRQFPGVEKRNVKVNQDRNPWAKTTVAAAVDPSDGNNIVVLNNDFRQSLERVFYHVSSDGGRMWSDDYVTDGADPLNGGAPPAMEYNPGGSFDAEGNTYMTHAGGNSIEFFTSPGVGYMNFDTEIDVIQGFGHGTYLAQTPIELNTEQCGGVFGTAGGDFDCRAALDLPSVTTDTNPNSPNKGTTYVYYTEFCNGAPPSGCPEGDISLPTNTSGVVEQHNSPSKPTVFSDPKPVQGTLIASTGADMVIDASGTPHILFLDFTPGNRGGGFPPSVFTFYESTLTNGTWVVSDPLATISLGDGAGNPNWGFGSTQSPGCSIHVNTAYCAFVATSLNFAPAEPKQQVYLAIIDTGTAKATFTRVNSDPIGNSKDHLFAWATATPLGEVYVGWYDDKNDPLNQDLQYFVAKSSDGGKTFPTQEPVSELFNPCTGSPTCSNFGSYTQLVSGPDGVVHATWQDTREGKSPQVWSQTVR